MAEGEALVRRMLELIGEDPSRDGLRDTPARVVRSWGELFGGYGEDPARHLERTFPTTSDQLVMVNGIEFFSTCEHHLLPFYGVAHVGYIPGEDGKVVGVSKLARVVELFARRPQLQERMTGQIADAIFETLQPDGVAVVIQAEHLCMIMRGIKKPGTSVITSSLRGTFRNKVATRSEFLSLILGR